MPTRLTSPNGPVTLLQRGPQGLPGTASLGFIDYSDGDASLLVLAPGVRTQLVRANPHALNFAKPPFDTALLWDGAKIRGRALHDTMNLRLDLKVRPLLAGGTLFFEIDVGGPFGPLNSNHTTYGGQTGTVQPVQFLAPLDFRTYLMANGGAIMLTSSVPCEISQASPLFQLVGAGS